MLLYSLVFEEIINPSKSLYLKKKLRQSRPGDLRGSLGNQLRMTWSLQSSCLNLQTYRHGLCDAEIELRPMF